MSMEQKNDRPFNISDAMLLIFASATSLLLARDYFAGPSGQALIVLALSELICLTPAAFFLQIRQPRPRLRKLARQPGFAATLAGTLIISIGIILIGGFASIRTVLELPMTGRNLLEWWVPALFYLGTEVGSAVIGVWALLFISGLGRSSKGWNEKLGLAIGVLWIAYFLFNYCTRIYYLGG